MSAEPTFILPAEWEPQDAIWLSWPVSTHIWSDFREEIEPAFAQLAAQFSYFEPVRINADGRAHGKIREHLNRARADLSVIELYDHPTDDVWCRDHGAVFVRDAATGKLAATDWQFNAWGGKFTPYDRDNTAAARMADALGIPCHRSELILEGGAIESNGAGVLLTTEEVLLNPNRNPEWSRSQVEAELRRLFGVREIFWLPRGLDHDDTDGHIDNMTRFIGENAILTAVEPKTMPAGATCQPWLEEARLRLKERFETVLELPLPEPDATWPEPRPASYLNYALVNDAVIVPSFGQPKNDDFARGLLADCFPGRKAVSFDCRLFLEEGGAVHCLSQHQPQMLGV
ncbi:agmatine deiminase family protein [Ruficoccus amylovorans]|uniref:Agmatine deiminase family protein n=1 Tax=Ruficoccus amylovorans TaxID=1804625 RepID=A0A842HEP1_9BACT|nr:agmatine deiminase family protein [Ruficoccus amylovorans]MBC2594690.1 agmatine deiminase family protein [Ruficoccus amylovorans]